MDLSRASMQQRWIFGYGSLMWRPGFEFMSQAHARIRGYHRSLCVYSLHHRGTEENPGLVLGLDRGGSCVGVAFQVEPSKWEATLAYLRAREQVSMVYVEKTRVVEILGSQRKIEALTYVVDRTHAQYAGKLSHQSLLKHVLQGEGGMGRCRDYVMNTLEHLRQMNIHDGTLEALGAELKLLGG
jgi:glutathione-specific gamma-glutamylcyclotransferase